MNEWDVLTNVFKSNVRSHPAMMAEPLSREHLPKLKFGFLAQPRPQFGQRAFLFVSTTQDKQVISSWYYIQNPEMENERFGYHKQANVYFVGNRNRKFNYSSDTSQIPPPPPSDPVITDKDKVSIYHSQEKVQNCNTSVFDVIIRPNDFEIYIVDGVLVENDILVNHDINIRRERIRKFMSKYAKKIQMEIKNKLQKEKLLKQQEMEKEVKKLKNSGKNTGKSKSEKSGFKKRYRSRSYSHSHSRSRSRSHSQSSSRSRSHSNRRYRSRSFSRSQSRSPSRSNSKSPKKIARKELKRSYEHRRKFHSSRSRSPPPSPLRSPPPPSPPPPPLPSSSCSSSSSSAIIPFQRQHQHQQKQQQHNSISYPQLYSSSSSYSALVPLSSSSSSSTYKNSKSRTFWNCEKEWISFMAASNYEQSKLSIGQWDIHLLPFFPAWDIDKLPFEKCFPECNTWILFRLQQAYGRENTIEGCCYKWRSFNQDIRVHFLIAPAEGEPLERIFNLGKDYGANYTSKTSGTYVLKVCVGHSYAAQQRLIKFAYANLTEHAKKQLIYKYAPSNIGEFEFKNNQWSFIRFIEPYAGRPARPSTVVEAVRNINQANYVRLDEIIRHAQ